MKVTKKKIREIGASDELYKYWSEMNEPDLATFMAKANEDEHFDSAIWLFTRVVETEDAATFAIYCAEQVLPIFEKEYPEDDRPRKAIQAAKDFQQGTISKEELESAARATSSASAASSSASSDAAWAAASSSASSDAAWAAASSSASSDAAWAAWAAAAAARAASSSSWAAARATAIFASRGAWAAWAAWAASASSSDAARAARAASAISASSDAAWAAASSSASSDAAWAASSSSWAAAEDKKEMQGKIIKYASSIIESDIRK